MPATSTSANRTGEPPTREVCEISDDVLDSADCVIDGGRCKYGVASTVVDIVEQKVFRRARGMGGCGMSHVVRGPIGLLR